MLTADDHEPTTGMATDETGTTDGPATKKIKADNGDPVAVTHGDELSVDRDVVHTHREAKDDEPKAYVTASAEPVTEDSVEETPIQQSAAAPSQASESTQLTPEEQQDAIAQLMDIDPADAFCSEFEDDYDIEKAPASEEKREPPQKSTTTSSRTASTGVELTEKEQQEALSQLMEIDAAVAFGDFDLDDGEYDAAGPNNVNATTTSSQSSRPPASSSTFIKTEPNAPIQRQPFSSSSFVASQKPPEVAPPSATYPAHFIEMLKMFYQHLFPFPEFHRWLNYGNLKQNYFCNREISYTLPSEAYIRFKSYRDLDEFRTECIRLCPIKIDIGAVYNMKPRDKKTVRTGVFQPMERELVFDIDMTDYDEVRTCCSGGDVCLKCWSFMTISIKIIDRVLRDDFGFEHLLWVYSGRRGVHCWVCDERARKMTQEARKALVGYIEVVKGGEGQARKLNLSAKTMAMHPSLTRAQKVLEQHFSSTLLVAQDVLGTKERWNKVLMLVNDAEIKKVLDDFWSEERNAGLKSEDRWQQLASEIKKSNKKSTVAAIRDIVFQYLYPRLDDNVSVGLNHLLKSPFCVHPKTGRVCVPIDPAHCEKFDPLSVPTLSELIEELERGGSAAAASEDEGSEDNDKKDDVKTDEGRRKRKGKMNAGDALASSSLHEHVEYFRSFLSGIERSMRDALREKKAAEDRRNAMIF
ncbi:primase, DNA, polypeptide 1 (49kDa) [Quaeritorhiza haematococci]|nr:primase, DNA, polypeptide 1 (49kDa) [Quaeritorhiza haematococci]